MQLTIPQLSIRIISQLQARERLRTLLWGLAKWSLVVVLAAIAAMTIDFQIDKIRDTPFWLLALLLLAMVGTAGWLFWKWVLKPWRNPPEPDVIAQRIEAGVPEFGHRLVTAIQLTRPEARISGMSESLIQDVSVEAEKLSQKHDLRQMVRGRPFEQSVGLFMIPLLAGAFFTMYMGVKLTTILLERLTLHDREIPHLVNLANKTVELWPTGEEVTLTYEATGPLREENVGSVRVKVEGARAEDYPLKFASQKDDVFTFQAIVPPGTQPFTHRAWLRGGRTKGLGEVRYEPRPVVSRIDAWVILPDYVGVKPDGTPYEEYMPQQGEVACRAGEKTRIEIETSKPVKTAVLHLLGQNADKKDVRLKTIPLDVEGKDSNAAGGSFSATPETIAYEIEVWDTFGFRNAVLPRRGIRILADTPPVVEILPERFTGLGEVLSAESEVDGMPLPLGKPVRIDYKCRSPLGLSKARLAYRVNEDPFQYLPLAEVKENAETGPWDFTRHGFKNANYQKTKLADQVEFTALPSPNPELMPARLEGAGAFTFQTKTLTKLVDGKPVPLDVGDRIEFQIEVYDRNPAPGREPGRSELRVKEIVTEDRFLEWILSTLQSESKLRDLEKKQRGVFEPDR